MAPSAVCVVLQSGITRVREHWWEAWLVTFLALDNQLMTAALVEGWAADNPGLHPLMGFQSAR
jgi:hypothetical protein